MRRTSAFPLAPPIPPGVTTILRVTLVIVLVGTPACWAAYTREGSNPVWATANHGKRHDPRSPVPVTTVTINGPTTGIITTDTIDLIGGGTIGAGSA